MMWHRQVLELLIIMLAVVARRGYYEVQRPHISHVQVFHSGDRLAIGCSSILGLWAAVENVKLNDFGQTVPDVWLLQSLHIWGWLSALFPLGLMVLHRWLQLGNFVAGWGRGLLSFGLPIALLPVLCWFPR
jgi:hypothetical protein